MSVLSCHDVSTGSDVNDVFPALEINNTHHIVLQFKSVREYVITTGLPNDFTIVCNASNDEFTVRQQAVVLHRVVNAKTSCVIRLRDPFEFQ